MIDNFEKIKELLKFGEDTYYFIQIIQRKKDHGGKGLDLRRWSKFLVRLDELDLLKNDIQELCQVYGGRAYIELNPRSLKKFTVCMMRKYLDRIYYQDYSNVYSIQNQVALSEDTIKTKGIIEKRRWMLDVDRKEDIVRVEEWIKEKGIVVDGCIPTISGQHFIIQAGDLGLEFDKDIDLGKGTVFQLKSTANTLLWV
jgi:hypothetical protein